MISRQTFNGGEISQEISLFRPDLARFHNSCKTVENGVVTPQGGIQRRRGYKLRESIDIRDFKAYDVDPDTGSWFDYNILEFRKDIDTNFLFIFVSGDIQNYAIIASDIKENYVVYDGLLKYLALADLVSIDPSDSVSKWTALNQPEEYDSDKYYDVDDFVISNDIIYQCLTAGSGNTPALSPTDWDDITWDVATAYSLGDYVGFGTWLYSATTGHTGQSPGWKELEELSSSGSGDTAFYWSKVFIVEANRSSEEWSLVDTIAEGINFHYPQTTSAKNSSDTLAEYALKFIQFSQSNDILYIVHPKFKPINISRYADNDWRVNYHEFYGGPYRPINTDETHKISIELSEWSAIPTYNTGDIVFIGNPGSQKTITAQALVFTKQENLGFSIKKYYNIKLTSTNIHLDYEIGEYVYIKSASDGKFDGQYKVVSEGTDYIEINVGTYSLEDAYVKYGRITNLRFYNNPGSAIFVGATAEPYSGFYQALQESSNDNPSTSPTYWKEVDFYSGEVVVRSNTSFFEASDVGSIFQIQDKSRKYGISGKTASGTNLDSTTTPSCEVIPAYGTITLTTGGNWDGAVDLERSDDGGTTWYSIAQITSNSGDNNGTLDRDIDEFGVLVRVVYTNGTGTDNGSLTFRLDLLDITNYINLLITEYVDEYNIKATTQDFLSGPVTTDYWAEAMFSVKNGFPSTICFHEERLVMASTERDPSTVCGSQINDWNNWAIGSLATSAIQFTIADSADKIQWMLSKQELLIGTGRAEWTIGSRSSENALSSENAKVKKHCEYGSAGIRAVAGPQDLFIIQFGERKIYRLSYDYINTEGYIGDNMSLMNSSILGDDGLVKLMYMRNPDTNIQVLRADNVIAMLTYNPQQEVMGWARKVFSRPIIPQLDEINYYTMQVKSFAILSGLVYEQTVIGNIRVYDYLTSGRKAYLNLYSEEDNEYRDFYEIINAENVSNTFKDIKTMGPGPYEVIVELDSGYYAFDSNEEILVDQDYIDNTSTISQDAKDIFTEDSYTVDNYSGNWYYLKDSGGTGITSLVEIPEQNKKVCNVTAKRIDVKTVLSDNVKVEVRGIEKTIDVDFEVEVTNKFKWLIYPTLDSTKIVDTVEIYHDAECIIEPTDIVLPDKDGIPSLLGNYNVSQVELIVLDSGVDIEVSVDDGNTWYSPTFQEGASPSAPYTGKLKYIVDSGYQEQVPIKIRATGNSALYLGAMNVIIKRFDDRR